MPRRPKLYPLSIMVRTNESEVKIINKKVKEVNKGVTKKERVSRSRYIINKATS